MTETRARGRGDGDGSGGARASRVEVRGTLISEDGRGEFEMDARIIVGRQTTLAPPSRLEIRGQGLVFVARDFEWLVTTTSGWIHCRGHGWLNGSPNVVPFRMDLYSAAADRTNGVGSNDRGSVRLYEAGTDPNLTSPSRKLSGHLAPGSVRALPGAKTAQRA